MSIADFLSFFGILSSLSSVCNKVMVEVKEDTYHITCIDMFGYISFEATVTVKNPTLKEIIMKYTTKLQVKANAKKK